MKVKANRLQIKLFDGPIAHMHADVNQWLSELDDKIILVDVEYNYQGPETNFDPERGQSFEPASHGILFVYDLGTSTREEKD